MRRVFAAALILGVGCMQNEKPSAPTKDQGDALKKEAESQKKMRDAEAKNK